MRTLILIILLPLGCYAQTFERNLFAENEIAKLYLNVNPSMRDSPVLNKEADRVLNDWFSILLSDSVDYSLFDQYVGYMVVCNVWRSKDLEGNTYLDMVLREETLVVKNAIGDNLYNHIVGSSEMGIASYKISGKENNGLDIYVALFR